MSRVLRNWRLKLVALLVASTTWGVVAYAGNPVVTRDLRGVTIQAGTPPNNWVIVSQLPQVNVTLSGLRQSLDAFQPAGLHTSVDLSGAKLGTNVLKVNVDDGDPRVSVTDVQPATVEVTLDQRDVVTKKVTILFKNSPPACCVAQTATATPDSVQLSGPKSVVAKAQPSVQVDLAEARVDIKAQYNVRLDGVDAKAAPLVNISPPAISVTVPIALVKQQVSAGIHVVKAGDVAAGYEVTNVRVTPDILQIEGDPKVVATVSSIDTDVVNVSGATGDVVRTVGLRPPPGVTLAAGQPSTVTVRITVVQTPSAQPSPTPAPSPSPSR